MAGSPPTESAQLELRLLGHFELVLRESGELIPVPAAKMRALVAYLAAAPRLTETRRRASGLLWAGRGEEQARQSLRQLLSNFRRRGLSETSGFLTFDDSNISLVPSVVVIDRTALIELRPDADVAELSRVADLYRNDFGLGLEIGEPDFDDWLHSERTRCRDAAISLFDRLVRMLTDLGRHEEALTRANRLVEIDPTREETHRLVIAQEAVVSGRASAMQRYEAFRVLLRDELMVRPEAATLRLLDDLRQQPDRDKLVDAIVDPGPSPPAPGTMSVLRPANRRWQLVAFAACLALTLGGIIAVWASRLFEAPIAYIDDDTGRASLVVLPFETTPGHDDLRDRTRAYSVEARTTFSHRNRLSVVETPYRTVPADLTELGRTLRVRYIVKTVLNETAAGIQANVSLIESASGTTVRAAQIPLDGTPVKFAREVARFIVTEIVLHRAKTFPPDSDATLALLWRGTALQISSRVGAIKPEEFDLFNRVLDKDPDQLYALLGLTDALVLRMARAQSPNMRADVKRAEQLMQKAYGLAPNLSEISLELGMLKKLQWQYEEAIPHFQTAVRADPTDWTSAAQVAHCKMFVGRLEEAYNEMEAVMPNLLPDLGAPESAFIAAETALVAGHTKRALDYLDIAISGNPTMPRLHALRAAALWLAGRRAEAVTAAALSQTLTVPPAPPITPATFRKRGGPEASEQYQAANGLYADALDSALALVPNP